MNRHCDRTKEFLVKSSVFALMFILIVEIEVLKNVIKNVLIFAESIGILMGLEFADVSQLYTLTRKWMTFYLIFSLIALLLIKVYLMVRHYFNSPKNNKLNPFENSLYKYIEQSSNGKGYLVTGEWGSGKTYIVNQFLDKYYKFSTKPIYRISCFGLDSRQLVLEEIKSQIEINDKSLFNSIQYIPVFGKPIYNILKDSYSLKSISKKSIFIFDDFERITSLGIATSNRTNKLYDKSTSLLRSNIYNRINQSREFDDISKEFEKVEKAFSKYSRENELISLMENLQKYNVVTGLINELVESYDLKVIIICNVDILGYDYVDKVFRGKLECITYNKSVDRNSIKNIFKDSLKNQIYSGKDIEIRIEDISESLINSFEKVWLASGNSNLRQAKSVIQAFLDTVNIISPRTNLDKTYLFSLFFSIYVVRVLRDENQLKNLDQFLVGGNLVFFLSLYEKNNLYEALKSIDNYHELKWVGISVSGFWVLNMETPENILNLVRSFETYEYNEIEKALLQENNSNWNSDKLLVEHPIYAAIEVMSKNSETRESQLDEISEKVKNSIGCILEAGNTTSRSEEEKVRNLLVKLDNFLKVQQYPGFLEKWFDSIYSYSEVESVTEEKNVYILSHYNQFVQKNKSSE